MTKYLILLLGLAILCAMGCAESDDSNNPYQQYVEAFSLKTQNVIKACREDKIDNVPIATKKSVFVSVKRALTDTRVAKALAKMDYGAGPVIKAELVKVYDCLVNNGIPAEFTSTTFALTAGKADSASENESTPSGSNELSASVYVPDLGNVSVTAVADSETVAVIMGTIEEGAQGAIKELEQLTQCLATIADCLAHVGLRNSWCIQNAHELNDGNAFCADGCCSHTAMVGMVHCMPSCGAGWVEETAFSQCENVTPADDGKCAWNPGSWW